MYNFQSNQAHSVHPSEPKLVDLLKDSASNLAQRLPRLLSNVISLPAGEDVFDAFKNTPSL